MLRALVLAGCVMIGASAPAAAQALPPLAGYTLAGDAVELPEDLSPGATLLVLTLGGVSEPDARAWRSVSERLDATHLTLVVMGARGRFARVTSAGSLRAAAPDDAPRNTIVPVYVDAGLLLAALGVTSDSTVVAVLVDSDGVVRARADGLPTPDLERAFAAASAKIKSGTIPEVAPKPAKNDQLAGAIPQPAPTSPRQTQLAAPPSATTEIVTSPAVTASPATATSPGVEDEDLPARRDDMKAGPADQSSSKSIVGKTLAGKRREAPGEASVLVLAGSTRDVAGLVETLERLNSEGRCAPSCLGLVAMGADPLPTRAFAIGRLRALVPDVAMRNQTLPVFMGADALFRMFDGDHDQAITTIRIE